MKSNRFYLASLRDTVGSNLSFHAKRGGYTSDLDAADVFTREEAQKAWNNGREFDQPVCADRLDAVSVFHVDCQLLPMETPCMEEGDQYVAFQTGRWDGNDVFWRVEAGAATTDIEQATIYEHPINEHGYVCLPFAMVDAVKRRTASIERLDRRQMVQAAGLITPEHIKRHRRRRPSLKTRWNCPGCGQLHWQENPYEFERCRNMECPEWRPSMIV